MHASVPNVQVLEDEQNKNPLLKMDRVSLAQNIKNGSGISVGALCCN